jgi:hypothetical protein
MQASGSRHGECGVCMCTPTRVRHVLLACPQACEREDAGAGAAGAGAAGEADAPAEQRVAESYDDAEFYQQLLKEFLEGSAAAGARVQSLSQVPAADLPLPAPSPPRRHSAPLCRRCGAHLSSGELMLGARGRPRAARMQH